MKKDNYDEWERLITPYMIAAGAHEIIFGTDGFPPLPMPQVTAAVGTPLHKDQKDTRDKWNRGNQAGIQTISLNLDVGQKHIIQQHKGKKVRKLWYSIIELHKKNTSRQRGSAIMKWMAFKQGRKLTLSEYISKINGLHIDLLLTVFPLTQNPRCFNSKLG